MDRFIRAQNVERYCGMLERVTDKIDRKAMLSLLAEEQQKQKNAGDLLAHKDGPKHDLRSIAHMRAKERAGSAGRAVALLPGFDPDQG